MRFKEPLRSSEELPKDFRDFGEIRRRSSQWVPKESQEISSDASNALQRAPEEALKSFQKTSETSEKFGEAS